MPMKEKPTRQYNKSESFSFACNAGPRELKVWKMSLSVHVAFGNEACLFYFLRTNYFYLFIFFFFETRIERVVVHSCKQVHWTHPTPPFRRNISLSLVHDFHCLFFCETGGQFSAESVDWSGAENGEPSGQRRDRDRRPTPFTPMFIARDVLERHRRSTGHFWPFLRLAQRVPKRIPERAWNQLHSRHDEL